MQLSLTDPGNRTKGNYKKILDKSQTSTCTTKDIRQVNQIVIKLSRKDILILMHHIPILKKITSLDNVLYKMFSKIGPK